MTAIAQVLAAIDATAKAKQAAICPCGHRFDARLFDPARPRTFRHDVVDGVTYQIREGQIGFFCRACGRREVVWPEGVKPTGHERELLDDINTLFIGAGWRQSACVPRDRHCARPDDDAFDAALHRLMDHMDFCTVGQCYAIRYALGEPFEAVEPISDESRRLVAAFQDAAWAPNIDDDDRSWAMHVIEDWYS